MELHDSERLLFNDDERGTLAAALKVLERAEKMVREAVPYGIAPVDVECAIERLGNILGVPHLRIG